MTLKVLWYYETKVLWYYFCLIIHVVTFTIFRLYAYCVVFFLFFFLCTLTSHPIYLFSAFYNTTIPLSSLSQLYDRLRLSSPYIRITLIPHTPLPYLVLRFYSIFALPFYYCYYTSYGPPLFFFQIWYHFTTSFRISFSISQCFPLSIFLHLLFYCLRVQLVFYHPSTHHFILSLLFLKIYFFPSFNTSFHLISAIFKNIFFPFLTTPDERLSPKRRIIKFFSKSMYFAIGSLIS